MENEIILTEQEEAQALHSSIIADKAITEQALTRIALNLKTMRDKKLYKQLGHDTFDEYCDKMSGIGSRQAYNLIRVLETFKLDGMERAAYLGSTKLIALTSLDAIDREELISSGEVEELSVRELKARIKELNDKCEQLQLFVDEQQDKPTDDATDEIERLKAELDAVKKEAELDRKEQEDANNWAQKYKAECERRAAEQHRLENTIKNLEEKNKQLENRPVDVAVAESTPEQIEKIKAQAANEAKKEYEKQLQEQKDKAKAKLEKLEQEHERQLAAERAEKEKLQSIAKNSPPSAGDKEILKYHIANVQNEFNAAVELLSRFDGEEQEKYRMALRTVAQKMVEVVGE